jgi:hypothetical protein
MEATEQTVLWLRRAEGNWQAATGDELMPRGKWRLTPWSDDCDAVRVQAWFLGQVPSGTQFKFYLN